MADLTTAPAAGNQGTTQNPQSVPSGQTISGASARSGSVQPGTSNNILTSQNGLSLETSTLTTVNLGADPAQTQTVANLPNQATQPKHHVNTALVGISIALVVIAIGLFWVINRSAKNTTD